MQTIWIVMPILILLMFLLGIGLDLEAFKRVAKYPKAVLAGMTGQLVVLPLLAFFIAWAFKLPAPYFIGLVLIACCPGGSSSNVFFNACQRQCRPLRHVDGTQQRHHTFHYSAHNGIHHELRCPAFRYSDKASRREIAGAEPRPALRPDVGRKPVQTLETRCRRKSTEGPGKSCLPRPYGTCCRLFPAVPPGDCRELPCPRDGGDSPDSLLDGSRSTAYRCRRRRCRRIKLELRASTGVCFSHISATPW